MFVNISPLNRINWSSYLEMKRFPKFYSKNNKNFWFKAAVNYIGKDATQIGLVNAVRTDNRK